MKINIEFAPLKNLYWAADITSGVGSLTYASNPNGLVVGDMVSSSLYVDYVYLDTDERRRFAQVSHEYLIEQLQFTGDESTSTTNNKIKLNFNHPTKELIWVVQPYDNVDPVKTGAYFGPQWFNYTDNFDVTYTSSSAFSVSDVYGGVASPDNSQYAVNNLAGGVPGVAPGGANRVFLPVSFEGGDNPTSIAKIQLNGHDRFAEMDGRYFNLVQPFQHHENIPSRGINVYSFGLKPEEHQPSGTCNFSRIDAANLNLTLTANTVNLNSTSRTAAVRVFAVNSAAKSLNKKKLVGFNNLRHCLMREHLQAYNYHLPQATVKGNPINSRPQWLKRYKYEAIRRPTVLSTKDRVSETERQWVSQQTLKIQSSRLRTKLIRKLQLQRPSHNERHGRSCFNA